MPKNNTLQRAISAHLSIPGGTFSIWVLTAGGILKGNVVSSLLVVLADHMKESIGDFDNVVKQFDEKIREALPIPENHQFSEPEEDFTLSNVLWQTSAETQEIALPWAVVPFDSVLAWGIFLPAKRSPKNPVRK